MDVFKRKKKEERNAWDRIVDILLFIPELIFYLLRFVVQGIIALFRMLSNS